MNSSHHKCLNVFNKKCSKKCRNLTEHNIWKLIELGFAGAHKLNSEQKICDSCRLQLSRATGSLLLRDLPVELLEHILSFLPLTDRKTASLVCHQWNDLAFSRRSLRDVVLVLNTDRDTSQLGYLRKSWRWYRNVNCKDYSIHNFGSFIDAFGLFGADLESFCCMTEFSEKQLLSILTRAPKLQQLHAGVSEFMLNRELLSFPAMSHLRDLGSSSNMLRMQGYGLKVPNLEQLTVDFFTEADAKESLPTLRRLAPQLKSLELMGDWDFMPIDELQFPKVEVLQTSVPFLENSDLALGTLFSGFEHLKELELECTINDHVLDVITTSNPGIEKLLFCSKTLNPNSFRLLERLKRLKSLSLNGSVECWITTEEYKPLTSVKRFCPMMSNLSREGFCQLLPNVIDMEAGLVHSFNASRDLVTLCSNYPRLQRLKIDTGLASSLSEALSYLDRLEELTLYNTRRPVAHLVQSNRMVRLKFEADPLLTDVDLLMLPKIYPKLRYLEVLKCRGVTARGIDAVRARLTRCVIHYDPNGARAYDFLPTFFEKPLM